MFQNLRKKRKYGKRWKKCAKRWESVQKHRKVMLLLMLVPMQILMLILFAMQKCAKSLESLLDANAFYCTKVYFHLVGGGGIKVSFRTACCSEKCIYSTKEKGCQSLPKISCLELYRFMRRRICLWLHNGPIRCQFHQHFMSIFYPWRSQKHKKTRMT